MTESLPREIIRSKRKTLALEITPEAALIVRAPQKTPLETIDAFIREKLPWIIKKQRIAKNTYQPPVKKEFIDGERFLYLGNWRALCIVNGGDEPFLFDGEKFLLSQRHISEARWLFLAWYKEQAVDILSQRVKFYAAHTGLKCNKINITNASKRCGSCNSKGRINFSWRLIMAPMEVIDYVVIHELVHLEEHNHSQEFWQKVGLLMPLYQQAKNWLQSNFYVLFI